MSCDTQSQSMSTEAATPTDDVMASVDADEYVIADISEEDAWMSIGVHDAPELDSWR